jgi:peptidyl-prolyl cis-trans isomerase D
MAKEFEDPAFALKANEVSGVVTTQYGYHVIQVVEKIPSKVTPFEAVRDDLERELRTSKVFETMQTTQNQMRADLLKDPAAAADVAKKFGAELITVAEASRGDAIPTLGVTPEIDSLLPSLQPGGVTDVVAIPGDRAVVAVLDKRTPGRPSTLDEARAGIREQLIATGAAKLLAERSKEAGERVRKGEDIETVARSLGAKVDGASNFAINDAIPGIGSAIFLEDAFKKGVGTVVGPTLMQGRTVVAKVIAKTEADMATFEFERPALLAELKTARARQNDTLWMDSIVRDLTEKGDLVLNDAAAQQIVSQLSQ